MATMATDIGRAQEEVNALKANILDYKNEMLKTYNVGDNEEFTTLTVSEEVRIAKAYREVCKEKEVFACKEEVLKQMGFDDETTVDKELIHSAEEMKKLMASYMDICKLLDWRFVEEMLRASTVEDVELLLQKVRLWLVTGNLRVAISLANLSVKIAQCRPAAATSS